MNGNGDAGDLRAGSRATSSNTAPFGAAARPWTQLTWQQARANRPVFFRRALKLTHGARTQLPFNGSQGLTVVSENPVYIEGNYNACTPSDAAGACTETGGAFGPTGNGHVSAAVIADAVTLLSSSWNDIASFINPHSLAYTTAGVANAQRNATTTWYRVAIIAGKGIPFPRPTNNTGADHTGLRHRRRRPQLPAIHRELGWADALNYRGSIVSFFTSRQAIGTYKCCDVVYGAPSRGYNFDVEFLSPPLLPPRTPMFRDINTLTFRQLLQADAVEGERRERRMPRCRVAETRTSNVGVSRRSRTHGT